jgi:replicative DNA helicase
MIQLQVLNKILDEKDTSIIMLNNLNDDYFSNYKQEFNYIKDHIIKYGQVPDKETFLSVFHNFEVIEVNEPDSFLVEELFKDYKRRKLTESYNKARILLIANKTEEATRLLTDTNESLAKVGVSLHPVDLLTDTSRYDAYEERTKNFSKFFVTTGFKELDSILGGWDREEENAVIIARTNVGKTWLLIKFAEAALSQGLRIGLYSGEMSAKKIGYRFDTISGHISNGSLVHGNVDIEQEYKNYINGLKAKYTGSFKVITPTDIGGPAGIGALRVFIQKEHLDILFVDQYSLLEDDRQAKNPVEQMSNIAIDMKILQIMEKIPIIAVSQMNRTKNDDDNIDSTQIAQSDRIGQNATVVLGIERDKKDKNLFKFYIVKARDANAGNMITYRVDLNKGIFEYIPSDKDGVQKDNDYSNRYQTDKPKGDVF